VAEVDDITAYQWGKLLLNLNNAPNALSGMTLLAQLMDRNWRHLMADQMAEGLRVLKAAGIGTRSTAPVAMALVPHILRLPTGLFRRVAAQMLTVDPTARTSMAYDLAAGRPTEIDALQGTIVRLGAAHGIATPICAHIAALIKAADAGSSGLSPGDLRPG